MRSDDVWISRGDERSLRERATDLRRRLQVEADWVEAAYPPGRQAAALCLELIDRRQAVVEQLEGARPVLCFCRGDARFAKVIRRPDGRVGFVDWEDSGLRDPARDGCSQTRRTTARAPLAW